MAPASLLADDGTTSSFSVKDYKPSVESVRPRVARRHCVGFKGPHEIYEIEKLDDEAREDVWYSREEYDIIKARNSLIIKMMKTGNFQETEDNSFRGLEHKLKEGFKERRANKFNALNAVLEEQERQMNRGLHNPDVIAESYRRVCLNALEKAFITGLRDAENSYCYQGARLAELSDVSNDQDDEEENQSQDCESTDVETIYSDYSCKRAEQFGGTRMTKLRSLFKGNRKKSDPASSSQQKAPSPRPSPLHRPKRRSSMSKDS